MLEVICQLIKTERKLRTSPEVSFFASFFLFKEKRKVRPDEKRLKGDSAMTTPVSVKLLNHRAKLPTYASTDAAGADLYALTDGPVTIAPGQTVLIHTGIALAIPKGYVGLVYARSGLATKEGLAPANKVGVIDADYRGELMVSLHNHGAFTQEVQDGERIAQLVITPVLTAQFCARSFVRRRYSTL